MSVSLQIIRKTVFRGLRGSIADQTNTFIAMTAKDGRTLVFNYEGDEVAETLYNLIQNQLERRRLSAN